MHKILIIGNSGSGKSWLSHKLSSTTGLPHVAMDSMFWQAGGFNKKRSSSEVNEKIQNVIESEKWIVEGVFGEIAEQLIASTMMLIYLSPSWEYSKNNLLKRNNSACEQANLTNLAELLSWASEYETRSTKSSRKFHDKLYTEFTGEKYELSTYDEISNFDLK